MCLLHQSRPYTGVMNDEARVPAAARLVRDFVNTREPQVDEESLTLPPTSRTGSRSTTCCRRTRSSSPPISPPRSPFARVSVRSARERRTFRRDRRRRGLNQALAELPLRMTFGQQGYRLVSVADTPIGHALGQLADAIRQCAEDGSWPRLKVCARDTCRWAFYDASRNQVRRWCSMAGCGNHIKMRRAYAARKSRAQGTVATEVSRGSPDRPGARSRTEVSTPSAPQVAARSSVRPGQRQPVIHRRFRRSPARPRRPVDLDPLAVDQDRGAVAGAHQRRDSVLAGGDRGVRADATGVHHRRHRDLEQGRPGRVGEGQTSTSPGRSRPKSSGPRITRTGPVARPALAGLPAHQRVRDRVRPAQVAGETSGAPPYASRWADRSATTVRSGSRWAGGS